MKLQEFAEEAIYVDIPVLKCALEDCDVDNFVKTIQSLVTNWQRVEERMTDVKNQQEEITSQVCELNAEAASKAQEHSIREKNAKNAKRSSSLVGGALASAA